MQCPITRMHVESDEGLCPVRVCQFEVDGVCRHGEMSTSDPAEFLDSEGKLEEAEAAKAWIYKAVYVEAYVRYATGKLFNERLNEEDMAKLRDLETYEEWPKHSVPFDQMLEQLNDYIGANHGQV